MNNRSIKLGEILLLRDEITQEQLNNSLLHQASSNLKLGEVLVQEGYVSELNVMKALSYQTSINFINLDNYSISMEAAKKISEKLSRRTNSIPISMDNDKLIVAMADPLNIVDIEDIEFESGMRVEVLFALKSQIIEAIGKYMSSRNTELAASEISKEKLLEDLVVFDNLETEYIDSSPVVRLINSLIKQSIKLDASDIHIEPYENRIRVRFRIDGDLQEILSLSNSTHSSIVTRVKVMSGMNIAEKRLPQDGRIEMSVDSSDIDMRISVIPTVYGEKIVIRILNREKFLKSKAELGITEKDLRIFDSIIEAPNGIILITGPTGSGKTTTLYSYLNELNKINKNIITVEDPVEYKIEGINQMQVNSKIGLTFSTGLRSILRQDPDVIMIGEIRDRDTAEIAVRAAITGHLVISTIHTNNAPSTIARLQDMGIENYLIAASLKGVMAQRLIKKICTNCKIEYLASKHEKGLLEAEPKTVLYKGVGCPKCYNTGYSGRIAVHEIMKVDKFIRDLIYKNASVDEINKTAVADGMITLKENCRRLVLNGVTTIEEYSKIVYRL